MFVQIDDYSSREYNLPNIVKNATSFTRFADKHEQKLLRRLFGHDMYEDFIAAYNASQAITNPVVLAQKWKDIVDGAAYRINDVRYQYVGLRLLLTPYIYALWVRVPMAGDMGDQGNVVTRPKIENAERAKESVLKVVNPYNESMQMIGIRECVANSLYGFLVTNKENYGNWDWSQAPLKGMNRYNL